MNVLIVDDETTVTDMITVLLGSLGYVSDAVSDGDLAIAKIQERPGFYDLLIMDHKMPRMTGLEVTQLLREMKFPGKIIILSGNLSQLVKETYKRLKVDMIIHKPFDMYEIEEALSGFARKMPKTP